MKKWNYFIAGLLGVLGILILIFPAFWIKLIVILLGLGAVGYGIYNFSYIKKLSDDSSYRSVIMVRSLVSIIIGLLAVILPMTVAETMWTIMIYVLAVYLVCSACLGFYGMYVLRNSDVELKNYLLENFILLAIAVFLFLVPAQLGIALVRILGLAVIAVGVFFGVSEWLINKKGKEIVTEVVETEEASSPEQTSDSEEK